MDASGRSTGSPPSGSPPSTIGSPLSWISISKSVESIDQNHQPTSSESVANPDATPKSSPPESPTPKDPKGSSSSRFPAISGLRAQFKDIVRSSVDEASKYAVEAEHQTHSYGWLKGIAGSKYQTGDNPFSALDMGEDEETEEVKTKGRSRNETKEHHSEESGRKKKRHSSEQLLQEGRAKKSALEETVTYQASVIKDLEDQLQKIQASLESKNKRRKDKIKSQGAVIKSLNDQLEEASVERDQYETKLKETRKQYKDSKGRSREEISRLQSQIEHLSTQGKNSIAETDSNAGMSSFYLQRADQLQAQVQELENTAASHESETFKLQEQLELEKRKRNNAADQLRTIQLDSQVQLDENLALRKQIEELQSALTASKESRPPEAQETPKAPEAEINKTEQNPSLHTVMQEKNDLERQVTDLNALLNSRKSEYEKHTEVLQNQVNTIHGDMMTFKIQAESAISDIKSQNIEMEMLRKDLEQLQRELTERGENLRLARSKIFTLTENIKKTEAERNSAIADIRNVTTQLRDSQAANKEKDIKILNIEGVSNGLRAQLEYAEQELRQSKARYMPRDSYGQVKDLMDQLEEKSEKVKELTRQINEQEERIQRAQEAAFGNFNTIKHSFLPDTQVKDQIENDLFGRLLQWAQDYVPRKGGSVTFDNQLEEKLKLIGNSNDSAQFVQKRPRIVLQGLLNQFVIENLFSPPFHLYPVDGNSNSQTFTDLLQELYNRFKSVDEVGCHTWRFHTFQMLAANREKSSESLDNTGRASDNIQVQYCQRLAQDFIEGIGSAFLGTSDDPAKRLQDLVDNFNVIADLSAVLWSQRTFVKIRGYEDFKDFPYSGSSPHAKAHNIHRLETKGEHSRDGAPIAMVVRPEILACGNEKGEEYDKERVWSEAIVLLGDD